MLWIWVAFRDEAILDRVAILGDDPAGVDDNLVIANAHLAVASDAAVDRHHVTES